MRRADVRFVRIDEPTAEVALAALYRRDRDNPAPAGDCPELAAGQPGEAGVVFRPRVKARSVGMNRTSIGTTSRFGSTGWPVSRASASA